MKKILLTTGAVLALGVTVLLASSHPNRGACLAKAKDGGACDCMAFTANAGDNCKCGHSYTKHQLKRK